MIYGIFGFWRILSAFCLVALFLRVAGQASNQSITADEAFNYNNFLRSSLGNVFTAHYDANNHVLQTALCWLSIHVFGVTELSLRIPSLVGSILYFYTVFQLASIRFNRSFLHLVATLALASNLCLLRRKLVGHHPAREFAGNSQAPTLRKVVDLDHQAVRLVGQIIAFLFPAGGLQTALLLSLLRCSGQQRLGAVVLSFIDSAGGPFLLWSFLILVIPLLTARPDAFYFGAQRWHETLGSLVSGSFFHNLEIPLLSRWPASFWHLCAKITTTFAPVLSGLILVAALLLVFRPSSSGHSMPTLTGLTFSVTVALLWFAHVLAHVKLPIMRTGVYVLFLFPLALLSFLPCEKDSPAGHLGFGLGWGLAPRVVRRRPDTDHRRLVFQGHALDPPRPETAFSNRVEQCFGGARKTDEGARRSAGDRSVPGPHGGAGHPSIGGLRSGCVRRWLSIRPSASARFNPNPRPVQKYGP